jgi:hypothetical protein
MATLNLQFSDGTRTISAGQLAGSFARFSRGTLSLINNALAVAGNSAIGEMMAPQLEAELTVAEELRWNRKISADAGLSFSISPMASGKVIVRKQGELFRITSTADPADDKNPRIFEVPFGRAYVTIALRAGLAVSGSAAYSHGLFGVKAGISSEHRFLCACHLGFSAGDGIRDAIAEAFRRFVFPLDADSIDQLAPGDFIEHEFFGKLAFSATAFAGFKGVFFGGVSNQALRQTLSSKIGSIGVQAKPSAAASASLDVKWSHEDAFRVVVGKTQPQKVDFAIFKMDASRLAVTLRAAASVKINGQFDLTPNLTKLTEDAVKKALAPLPDALERNQLIGQLTSRIKKAPGMLEEFADEARTRTNSFLKKLDRLTVDATLAHERISEHTALLSLTFDWPAAKEAMKPAMAGDLAGALKFDGVEAAVGSFVHSSLVERNSLALQFFEAFRVKTLTEYFQKSELVYAGNGILQFRFLGGMKASSDVFGHKKAIEMYFSAAAAAARDGGLSDKDVTFTIKTNEENEPKAALQSAAVVEAVLGGPAEAAILRAAIARNPNLNVRLSCTLPADALKRLSATPFVKKNQPAPLPHAADAANYAAFVDAVDLLFDQGGFQGEGFPDRFSSFAAWAQVNLMVNTGSAASPKPPNRRNKGNPFIFAPMGKPLEALILTYLNAAQGYMNLCDDLGLLARAVDEADTLEALSRIVEESGDLVKKDSSGHPLHFTKPLLIALVRSTRATPKEIDAPEATAKGASLGIVFA